MKPSIPVLSLLVYFFISTSASGQINFFPEELFVKDSALNLRDRPDKSGKVVEKLPHGAALTLVEAANDGQYVEVDSVYGAWLKVQYKNKSGYVFSPHVIGAFNLYQEGDAFDEGLPGDQNWYGLYMRDSFADELRKIDVHLEKTYSELYDDTVNMLKTNQKDQSKFIIGSAVPLTPGFAGNLGAYDPGSFYLSGELSPGSMLNIYPGQDANDTTQYNSCFLAAVGCARFDESDYVKVSDYRLFAFESLPEGQAPKQDLTGWVQPEEGMNPSINLVWFGDLDHDHKPDALIQDMPAESSSRMSLFLSSKARPGEYLHKVCEYYFPID